MLVAGSLKGEKLENADKSQKITSGSLNAVCVELGEDSIDDPHKENAIKTSN